MINQRIGACTSGKRKKEENERDNRERIATYKRELALNPISNISKEKCE